MLGFNIEKITLDAARSPHLTVGTTPLVCVKIATPWRAKVQMAKKKHAHRKNTNIIKTK